MTIQQLFEKLQKEFAEKADVFIPLEEKISKIKGFGDLKELDKYYKAKKEWQIASNKYWAFIANLQGKDFNPNDEVSIEQLTSIGNDSATM